MRLSKTLSTAIRSVELRWGAWSLLGTGANGETNSGLVEPTFALIVHEAPNNPCSERTIIQQWFADHGYPIQELSI